MTQRSGEVIEIAFDADGYTRDVLERAAYRLARVMSIAISRNGDAFLCHLHPTDSTRDAAHEFRTAALDELLRERIRVETAPLRNAILALAFARVDFGDEA